MCGIACTARLDGTDIDQTTGQRHLDELVSVLSHRGPDASRTMLGDRVGLAFTRLSLVGPENGDQPLTSDDGDVVLVVNGEVYNHRELESSLPTGTRMRTRSDCEVLLHLYRRDGLRFLDDVRGMFGLVLWDRRAGRLVLARDRFGIKPLYVHRDDQRLVAGSEITSLFTDPRTPRRVDWAGALRSQALAAAPRLSDPQPSTWFEDVELVPAGTIWSVDLDGGATTTHRYWRLEDHWDTSTASPNELVLRYRELLQSSVRECASADSELGLFLSGGVDSSTVLAMAVDLRPDIHTFSVVSPGTRASGDVEAAARCAAHFDVPHHQVEFPQGRVPTPDQWRRLLWLVETPMCGPEIYYKHELHRYAREARPELRGMLLGSASDEFNGGYTVDIGGDGWGGFEAGLASLATRTDLHRDPGLDGWWIDQPSFVRADAVRVGEESGWHPYHRYLLSEHRKIQQYNVWHEDRTAAGSGTEARVPFLDHRLVELVAGIRATDRPKLLWDKEILRRAVADLLPPDLARRAKVPFFYGPGTDTTYRMLLDLLLSSDRELVEQALSAPGAGEYLDRRTIHGTLDELTLGMSASPRVELLLRVVNLGVLADLAAGAPRLDALDAGKAPLRLSKPTSADPEPSSPLSHDGVLTLAEHTRLLRDDTSWYLLAEDVVEYELDPGSPTLAVLRALGVGPLGVVVTRAGTTMEAVERDLQTLVDEGLLRKEAHSATRPEAASASSAAGSSKAPTVAK